jgi:hypothetical protein
MANVPPNNDLWRLVESDTDHAKGIAFNMLFIVWRRKTLVGPYMRAVQIVKTLATEFPKGSASAKSSKQTPCLPRATSDGRSFKS